jgi:hypothetical protein
MSVKWFSLMMAEYFQPNMQERERERKKKKQMCST